jgi:hypothetical protein
MAFNLALVRSQLVSVGLTPGLGIGAALSARVDITATVNGRPLRLRHDLSTRQIGLPRSGAVINWLRERIASGTSDRPKIALRKLMA